MLSVARRHVSAGLRKATLDVFGALNVAMLLSSDVVEEPL
jgi:hypothetical protein